MEDQNFSFFKPKKPLEDEIISSKILLNNVKKQIDSFSKNTQEYVQLNQKLSLFFPGQKIVILLVYSRASMLLLESQDLLTKMEILSLLSKSVAEIYTSKFLIQECSALNSSLVI